MSYTLQEYGIYIFLFLTLFLKAPLIPFLINQKQ